MATAKAVRTTAIEIAAHDAKSASLEKVLYLGKPQERTFRYAD
jgi:hypothetical protein